MTQAMFKFSVPGFLGKILNDYLDNRILLYDTDEGVQRYAVSRAVPQGSVLCPILCNAMYNAVLSIRLPEGVTIVGHADHVILVVVAKHIITVERKCSEPIQSVQKWLRNNGLELAMQKTEAVLLTTRKTLEAIRVEVDGHVIESASHLRYLGVDALMKFQEHLNLASERAKDRKLYLHYLE